MMKIKFIKTNLLIFSLLLFFNIFTFNVSAITYTENNPPNSPDACEGNFQLVYHFNQPFCYKLERNNSSDWKQTGPCWPRTTSLSNCNVSAQKTCDKKPYTGTGYCNQEVHGYQCFQDFDVDEKTCTFVPRQNKEFGNISGKGFHCDYAPEVCSVNPPICRKYIDSVNKGCSDLGYMCFDDFDVNTCSDKRPYPYHDSRKDGYPEGLAGPGWHCVEDKSCKKTIDENKPSEWFKGQIDSKCGGVKGCAENYVKCLDVDKNSFTDCDNKFNPKKDIITPVSGTSGGGKVPASTGGTKAPVVAKAAEAKPSRLELSVNGDTSSSTNHSPGEKVNLAIRIFNDNVSPNNGCPLTSSKVIFKVNGAEVAQSIACQPQSYTIPDLGLTESTKTFTFSANFGGDSSLGSGNGEQKFIVTKNAWVKTFAEAQINGYTETTATSDLGSVNIGARITTDSGFSNCIINDRKYLSLKLVKNTDGQGKTVNQVVKQIDNADNCQSYPADLSGAGDYTLEINFDSQGKLSYAAAKALGKLKISQGTKQPTQTSIDVSINSPGDDPSFNIAPKTLTTGKCDTGQIGFIGVTVNTSGGDTGYLELPNCSTITKNLSAFITDANKLKGLSSVTFNAKYLSTAESPWGPSTSQPKVLAVSTSGDVAAASGDQKVSLSFDVDPSDGGTSTNLTATTTKPAAQPKFNVSGIGNLINPDQPVDESCKDGKGTCTYRLALTNLSGDYKAKFCAGGDVECSSEVSFTTKSSDTGSVDSTNNKTIQSATLTINGSENQISADGSVTVHINSDSVGQITLKYSDGSSNTRTIKFKVGSAGSQNSGSNDKCSKFLGCSDKACGDEKYQCDDGSTITRNKKDGNCGQDWANSACKSDSGGSTEACPNEKFLGCSDTACGDEKFQCDGGITKIKNNKDGNCGQDWANSACNLKPPKSKFVPPKEDKTNQEVKCKEFSGCHPDKCGIEVYNCTDGSQKEVKNKDGNCGDPQYNNKCEEKPANNNNGDNTPSCKEDTTYCDDGKEIRKHGGYYDSDSGECIYAFDETGNSC